MIRMENNSITGQFPSWITELPSLRAVRFWNNSFTPNAADEAMIAALCNRPGMNCTSSGLPGVGGTCQAFGPSTVLLYPYQRSCWACPDGGEVIAKWYGLVIGVLIAVVVYVFLVRLYAHGGYGITKIKSCTSDYPTSLKGWVTCSCIISLHLQTTILVGSFRPYWPRSVRHVIAAMSLEFTTFTAPECMVANAIDGTTIQYSTPVL